MTQTTLSTADLARRAEKRLNKGAALLHERVAEAFEPDWLDLLDRIYHAMRRADL